MDGGPVRWAGGLLVRCGPGRGFRLAGRIAFSLLLLAWCLAYVDRAGRPLLLASAAAAAVATLLVQRRWPLLPVVAALLVLLVTGDLAGYPGPDDPYLVLLVLASFGAGRHAPLRAQPWVAAGVLLYAALVVAEDGDAAFPAQVVFPVLLMAAPWLLGLTARLAVERAERTERDSAALRAAHAEELASEVAAAAQAERLSLARDLHDVVAHSVSAISLQAQVARHRAQRGERVGEEELLAIERSARAAMTDLRRMLGLLRPADGSGGAPALAPAADLRELPQLLERCRASGQRVDCVQHGAAQDLTPALSADAYRIVQEALTNARRHGTGEAVVELDWSAGDLGIRVTNPLPRDRGAGPPGGHGLIGMRERVAAAGGDLRAGPRSGHWVIDVRLPLTMAGAR